MTFQETIPMGQAREEGTAVAKNAIETHIMQGSQVRKLMFIAQ
jgi:hypothetical protein